MLPVKGDAKGEERMLEVMAEMAFPRSLMAICKPPMIPEKCNFGLETPGVTPLSRSWQDGVVKTICAKGLLGMTM